MRFLPPLSEPGASAANSKHVGRDPGFMDSDYPCLIESWPHRNVFLGTACQHKIYAVVKTNEKDFFSMF